MNFEYALLIPEFILAGAAAVVLLADAFRRDFGISRRLIPAIAVLGALAAGIASLFYANRETDFAGLIGIDDYTLFFRVLFTVTVLVVILGSLEFVERNIRHQGEFYALLLVSTIGAIYMAGARELLTAYISIELLSFSLYVAVSLAKDDRRSGEAGLKYVLLGGVASAMLLYGLSLIYGAAGTTSYEGIAEALGDGSVQGSPVLLLGLAFLVGGLGFKASAVPFHMWTPDAYEGAPLPVTAYIAATSKAATFALLLRLFGTGLLPVQDDWQWMLATLSVATMVTGNLIALVQTNIKRLLAYSSIGQVGFMLMAVTTVSDASSSALLLHLAGYLVTNLAVFIAVIAVYNRIGSERIEDFRGLAETQPYLALVITTGLFSLSGMPLLAGFVTKFFIFQAAAEEGFLWLSGVAVIMSTVSLYYYLKVIRVMYVVAPAEGAEGRWRPSLLAYGVTGVLFLGIFVVGLWAAPVLEVADDASAVLFG